MMILKEIVEERLLQLSRLPNTFALPMRIQDTYPDRQISSMHVSVPSRDLGPLQAQGSIPRTEA